jgi:toxin ParE1/3/4
MKVTFSKLAEQDIARIYAFGVGQFGEKRAELFQMEMVEHFKLLARAPYMYPAVEQFKEGYRRSIIRSSSVFYKVLEEEILIVRILGRQDTGVLFRHTR